MCTWTTGRRWRPWMQVAADPALRDGSDQSGPRCRDRREDGRRVCRWTPAKTRWRCSCRKAKGPRRWRALSALDVTPSEVALSARINPDGPDTHYFFQYGTADCVSEPAACTDVPAAPGTDLGGGFGEQRGERDADGLDPEHHLPLPGAGEQRPGRPRKGPRRMGRSRTLPSSAGLLADGRAWELVSPAEKDGSGIEPFEKEGSLIQAAAHGGAVTYVANGPVVPEPEGSRAPEPTQVLSARTPAGWSSQDLMTPHEQGEGLEAGEPSEFRFFSEDLALSLVQPPDGKVRAARSTAARARRERKDAVCARRCPARPGRLRARAIRRS